MGTGLQLEHVYRWEKSRAGKPWLVQPVRGDARVYTWSKGVEEARRIAAHLRSLELPPGSTIALYGKSSAHWIMADLAIWMAGHVSVPLYSTASAANIRQILEHSESKLLFVGRLDGTDALREGAGSIAKIALPLAPAIDAPQWDDLVAKTSPLADSPTRKPDELATIIYTSGTTGVPKGVMLTFGAMAYASTGASAEFPVNAEDRILCHLPLAHAAERLISENGSIFNGFTVYFTEGLDTFLADLQRARPTLFFTVPRLWQKFQLGVFSKVAPAKLDRMLRIPLLSRFVKKKLLGALGLGHVRIAGSGAAPISAELLHWYAKLGLEIYEGYGMTENFGYCHGNRPGKSRPGYVGTPYPNVECRIADDGEVQMKSPSLLTGYFKEPQLTAESFTPDGFFRTGDRGEIDSEGRLRITGRVKELFKTSKGKYVAPAPIENLLVNHPFVEAVCVSGAARPQPHALVMLGEDARKRARDEVEASLAAHVQTVNSALEPHEALAFVAVVRDVWMPDNGFLTPTMKIKRSVVESAYERELDAWYATSSSVIWQ